MRTIAIINLKGGVAKTTSSVNIAYILTTRGYKVLLVDNDKQGDCSRGLNRRTSDGDGIDRIMTDRHPDMQSLIHNTDYAGLDIITANLGLLTANMEVTMDRVRPQQNRLKKALQQVADQYDFCVVDNAPDINISVINALTAANDVLIPVEVDDNTLEGMNELLDQIQEVKRRTESGPAERPLLCEQVPEREPGTHSGSRDHQRAVSGYGYNNPLFWCSGKEHIHAYAGGSSQLPISGSRRL